MSSSKENAGHAARARDEWREDMKQATEPAVIAFGAAKLAGLDLDVEMWLFVVNNPQGEIEGWKCVWLRAWEILNLSPDKVATYERPVFVERQRMARQWVARTLPHVPQGWLADNTWVF